VTTLAVLWHQVDDVVDLIDGVKSAVVALVSWLPTSLSARRAAALPVPALSLGARLVVVAGRRLVRVDGVLILPRCKLRHLPLKGGDTSLLLLQSLLCLGL